MRFNKVLMSSAVVVAAFAGAQAQAAGPTLSEVLGNSGITLSGAFDVSYDFSPNDIVTMQSFSGENDAFVFHQANLSAGKDFGNGIGAGLNVILGKDANVVSGDVLDGDDFDLTQAYVSKTWGNLSLTGGRFVTLAGMEVINPAGNLNASRSLLFFSQPLVHEGVRASYKVNDLMSVTLGLNNAQFATSCGPLGFEGGEGEGCSQAGIFFGSLQQRDNNTDSTVEAQVALTPSKSLSVFLTAYSGNEDTGDGDGFGNGAKFRSDTVDLVVNFNLTDAIYLGLNADYFNEEEDGGGSDEAKGVAGYVGVKLMPKLRVAARSEYLTFDDGAGNGQGIFRSNTLTIGHACSDNLELILEGRHDKYTGDGGEPFFPIKGTDEDDQYSGTLKAILKF